MRASTYIHLESGTSVRKHYIYPKLFSKILVYQMQNEYHVNLDCLLCQIPARLLHSHKDNLSIIIKRWSTVSASASVHPKYKMVNSRFLCWTLWTLLVQSVVWLQFFYLLGYNTLPKHLAQFLFHWTLFHREYPHPLHDFLWRVYLAAWQVLVSACNS